MKPLLLAFASCAAFLPAAPAGEEKITRHSNQEKTFSAEFPSDFKVDVKSSAKINGSRLRGIRGDLMVTLHEEPVEKTGCEAYAAARLARCTQALKDCKVEEKGDAKVGEREAKTYVLSWTGAPGDPEKPMKMLLCVFVGNERGYEIACFAPAEAFADSRKTFEKIAFSVRLTETPKAP